MFFTVFTNTTLRIFLETADKILIKFRKFLETISHWWYLQENIDTPSGGPIPIPHSSPTQEGL
jgi:hypothetical protein